MIPGSCSECSDECLENSAEYDEGVLPGGSEVDKGECDEGMDEEPEDDRQHVEPQALHHHPRVLDVQDLPTHQKHDTNWRVPTEQRVITREQYTEGEHGTYRGVPGHTS